MFLFGLWTGLAICGIIVNVTARVIWKYGLQPSPSMATLPCAGVTACVSGKEFLHFTQARMREMSRRTLASSSFSSRRCLTKSPMLTMPFSSLFSMTGK